MLRLKRTPTVTSFTFSNDGTSMTSGCLRAGKENCTVQRRTLKFRVTVTRMMTQTVLKISIKNHQQQRVDKESGNMYSKILIVIPIIVIPNYCTNKKCVFPPKKKRNCKMMDSSMFSICHANRCQLQTTRCQL